MYISIPPRQTRTFDGRVVQAPGEGDGEGRAVQPLQVHDSHFRLNEGTKILFNRSKIKKIREQKSCGIIH